MPYLYNEEMTCLVLFRPIHFCLKTVPKDNAVEKTIAADMLQAKSFFKSNLFTKFVVHFHTSQWKTSTFWEKLPCKPKLGLMFFIC